MAELRWLSLLCMVPACAFVATTRPTRGGGGVATSPTRPATTSLRSVDAAAAIFELLADDVVLLDPADGQCCRNQCASCSYYELEDGAPVYRHEELTGGRWLPARPVTEVPPRLQVATWVEKLFPDDANDVSRSSFEEILAPAGPEGVDDAWRALTSAPKILQKNEMASRLGQLASSGAVDEATFADALAAARAAPRGDVVDYESMETAALKALARERGIKPLPVKRLVIEDLRFYDAHGVAGKRHPRTRALSLP